MNLPELYIYFSRFVPVEVLRKNYVQGQTPDHGAAQIQQEVLDIESDERIETLSDYLFLGDQDFVLERLRNSRGQLLMLDSDRIDYQPDTDNGMKLSIALTIAEHYNQSNASVVSELAVQNRCLETLRKILLCLWRDAEQDHCPACMETGAPFEIRFLDLKQLNGLIGYTAFLDIKTCAYELS